VPDLCSSNAGSAERVTKPRRSAPGSARSLRAGAQATQGQLHGHHTIVVLRVEANHAACTQWTADRHARLYLTTFWPTPLSFNRDTRLLPPCFMQLHNWLSM
jgi:hypothetical protein